MWGKDEAECGSHLAQLYGDDGTAMVRTAARYLRRALRRGEGLAIIATARHAEGITQALEREAMFGPRERAGLVLLVDADATMARLMVDGQPDAGQFERLIGGPIRDLREAAGRGVRIFGELVGLLWSAGEPSAAQRLEEYWNVLLRDRDFDLFCPYPIDVFGEEFAVQRVDALLCSHGRVITADRRLESSVRRAMREVLGVKAEGVELLMETLDRPYWALLPKAEAMILWLKNVLPDEALTILGRARAYQEIARAA
jgi:hypothetical protein